MMISDAAGRRAIDWAFLFLGSNWDAAQAEIWPLYFRAETARNGGERDYRAEACLFSVMTAYERPRTMRRYADLIQRYQARRKLFEPLVLSLEPQRPGSPPRRIPSWALDRWSHCERRVERLATRMHQG